MRFVVAIVLFVVAFAGIGLGIAQRTILAGPDHVTAEVSTGSAPVTVIDGATLNALPGTQSVAATGSEQVFMAYGRTGDVLAWVGEADYNLVTWDAETQSLESELQSGTEESVPNPAGSDLWVQEFDGVEELTRNINVPATASVLIVADGEAAAPSDLSITWPLDNSAPWSGPLVVGGGLALLLGLAAFVWALLHARRARGPRRKQPKQPKLPKPPKPPRLKPAKARPALEAAPADRPRGRRRLFAATGVVLSAGLLLSGCSADDWPDLFPAATPTPVTTAPVDGAEELDPPAVTEPQLARIMERVAATVGEADAARNGDLAAQRLAGPALALRTANYTVLSKDAGQPALPPIPAGPVRVVLPQQVDIWPRTVFAVVKEEEATAAPVAVMLVQESPRENYKAHYVVTLEPSITLPKVAAPAVGAPRLSTDQTLGIVPPRDVAPAYADLLLRGAESEYAPLFEEQDSLRAQIGVDYKAQRRSALPATAKIDFANRVGEEPPIAFGTVDSGQLVAVSIVETETVTPVEAGAAINPRDSVLALLGVSQTTKGVVAEYGVQVLFYVPPVGETDATVQLLGFSQGLIGAREV